ncbi:hypothetical protein [Streptomyces mexicanus]
MPELFFAGFVGLSLHGEPVHFGKGLPWRDGRPPEEQDRQRILTP